ncbi:MarR family transcriptional regulator [uncultured Ferrimonas sp.]|uniref:MarR family winged helix-turn-helix transcriptional regulator n=1 Tax=uncultured Ferrimonas sp. TaxID=432640 RepID=UPI002631A30D|nr:MarR family transcriptional regulator [uncultured Ferrimonas sp.]
MTEPTLANQLCFSLYRANHAMSRLFRPLLLQFDLTYPQYLMLLALWQQDGVKLKTLAQQTELEAATVTPILKRLEGKGLLERRSDPDDERAKLAYLTVAGHHLKAPLFAAREQLYQRIAPNGEPDHITELRLELDRLSASLERLTQS